MIDFNTVLIALVLTLSLGAGLYYQFSRKRIALVPVRHSPRQPINTADE